MLSLQAKHVFWKMEIEPYNFEVAIYQSTYNPVNKSFPLEKYKQGSSTELLRPNFKNVVLM